MVRKEKAARGAKTEAASNWTCHDHLTERLALLKKILLAAYCGGGLSFDAAEGIAARMRQRYPLDWSAA